MSLDGPSGVGSNPQPMSIHEEMAMIKRAHQDAMRRAAAEQAARERREAEEAAARETREKAEAAKQQLDEYEDQVRQHQRDWVAANGHRYGNSQADLQRMQGDWEAAWARDGQAAERELAPYLAEYDQAVKNELRLAAEHATGDPTAAINRKRDEIKARDQDCSWEDRVLDDIAHQGGDKVTRESPEIREAALETNDALNELEQAQADLAQLEREMQESLQNVHNGFLRQEIRDAYQPQLTDARSRVTSAEQAANDALNKEFALELTGRTLADARAYVRSASELPPGPLRRIETQEARTALSTAEHQYNEVLAGRIDLEHYSQQHIDPAMQAVFARHPDLFAHPELVSPLIMQGQALKVKPELDANLVTLNPDDPAHADWFRQLARDPNQRVTAALIETLGVSGVRPENDAETALAQADPMAFATLKYVGGSLPHDPAQWGQFDTEESQAAAARTAAGQVLQRLSLDPAKVQKFQELQALMIASGDVRADWVESEVNGILASQTPQAGVEQRVEDREGEERTAGERALQLIRTNVQASFTPDQQAQIWDQVRPQMQSYIGEQADYIETHYPEHGHSGLYGTWLENMARQADPVGASLLLDTTMSRVDPKMIYQNGGQLKGGLQLAVERAPQRAADVARWAHAGRDEYHSPASALVMPQEDGTGVTLARAALTELRQSNAPSDQIEIAQQAFDHGMEQVQEHQAETVAQAQYEQLNGNAIQEMFDDLARNSGTLYSQQHDFSNLRGVERDNLIGDGLRLTPDNPNAGPGEARYTSQENLDQIRQVDSWIRETGGDHARVKFVPAIYASSSQGVMPLMLLHVEGDQNNDRRITDDENFIVDASAARWKLDGKNVAWKYDDFEAFQKENQLDDNGKLYMSSAPDLLLRDGPDADNHVDVNLDGVDAAITTGWERVRRVGDIALGVAGAVAGVLVIAGTGGLAAPIVLGVASLYGAYRINETRNEMAEHGQSFNPINTRDEDAWFGVIDPTAGGLYLGAIANLSGFAALRPVGLLRTTAQLGRGASLADDALLTSARLPGASNFHTNAVRDLFGINQSTTSGLRTTLYQSQLAGVSRPVAYTAMASGVADIGTQGMTIANAAANGEINLSDWSLFSRSWDVALLGGGVGSFAAGFRANRSHNQFAANSQQPGAGQAPGGAPVPPPAAGTPGGPVPPVPHQGQPAASPQPHGSYYLAADGQWRQIVPGTVVPTTSQGQSRTGQVVIAAENAATRHLNLPPPHVRPDGTPVQRSPISPGPYGPRGTTAIARDTGMRAVDQASNAAPRYGHYPQSGDLVDSVFGLPIEGVPAGSTITIRVNGEEVQATVIEVTVPQGVGQRSAVFTPRDQQAVDGGLIDEGLLDRVLRGDTVETSYRLSGSGPAGQTRANTPGRVVEGAGHERSPAGELLHQTMQSGPQHWTPELIRQVRDVRDLGLRSTDPDFHGAAQRAQLRLDDRDSRVGQRIDYFDRQEIGLLLDAEAASTARSAAGQSLHEALHPNPRHWTPELRQQVRDYLTWADRSHDPNLRDAATRTRAELGRMRLPETGSEITPQHRRALDGLLEADRTSPFTGSKWPGVLSANGEDVLTILAAQSENPAIRNLGRGDLVARLDPAAPDHLTGDGLASQASWTVAGRRAAQSYLHELSRHSTDPHLARLANEALPLIKGRKANPGRPVTPEQADGLVRVLQADRQSRWTSGIELNIHPSFKGRGNPSPEGETVRLAVEEAQQHWTRDVWREMRHYVGLQKKSTNPEVRILAAALENAMPNRMPRPGTEINSEVLRLLPELLAADQASLWRVTTRGVDWQTVYRPDRSTISQLQQDHWSYILLTKGLSDLIPVTLPIPSRQAYMEWSVRNNGPRGDSDSPNGTGFLSRVHPGDVEGRRHFPNGWRPNLIYDPNGDPSHPWVLAAPMHVKITAQTETALGIGWPSLGVSGIRRSIRYLGSHEGRPGYMLVEPMRLTNEQASFIETAFRGGVNHYNSEGSRVGPAPVGGERLLFRNYLPLPIWAGREAWRRGLFADLPRETSAGPRRVLDRTDQGLYASVGTPVLPLTIATAEVGTVRKALTEHRGLPRPHPSSSTEAQAAFAALRESGGRWTPEVRQTWQNYLDYVRNHADPDYRAAGDLANEVLFNQNVDRAELRRTILQARLPWHTGEEMSRGARRAQLREAKVMLRDAITSMHAHVLDTLLMHDIRVHGPGQTP